MSEQNDDDFEEQLRKALKEEADEAIKEAEDPDQENGK